MPDVSDGHCFFLLTELTHRFFRSCTLLFLHYYLVLVILFVGVGLLFWLELCCVLTIERGMV